MLRRIARLKAAAATATPIPLEFAAFRLPSPAAELESIYRSREFHSLLRNHTVQLLAFRAPAAPFWILEHCPEAVPLAIRSYLQAKNLESAFSALTFLPRSPPRPLPYLVASLGCTASVWSMPISALIASFWCGLGVAALLPARLEYVRWQQTTPSHQRDPRLLGLCDHIVAWYEDNIGTTTENWHRAQHATPQYTELDLTQLLAGVGVERQQRRVDLEYADYWTHRDDFKWREPDQDPAYYLNK